MSEISSMGWRYINNNKARIRGDSKLKMNSNLKIQYIIHIFRNLVDFGVLRVINNQAHKKHRR